MIEKDPILLAAGYELVKIKVFRVLGGDGVRRLNFGIKNRSPVEHHYVKKNESGKVVDVHIVEFS